MSTLRETEANARVVQRIESLSEASPRQWGKMDVAQMLRHCQLPFRVAAGEMEMKRRLIGRLFGGLAKKKFVDGEGPFHRNAPTDPKFRVAQVLDLEQEQAALIELVRRFGEVGPRTREPHPFFGPLTPEEWDRLMWKHVDHHLRQFGV